MRTVTILAALMVSVLVAPAATARMAAAPVARYVDDRFGPILATPKHQALYFWNVERRDHRIHCTGACAKAWPPLAPAEGMTLPAGVPGELTTIERTDGTQQVA